MSTTDCTRPGPMAFRRGGWGAIVLGLALLPSAVPAQAPRDPVDAFAQAIERDLDNLKRPIDAVRGEIRKSVLNHRKEVLTNLAAKITTAADISRVLRIPYTERLRRLEPTDQDELWLEVDGPIFASLLNRFYDQMETAVQGKDARAQESFAIVTGDLVSNTLRLQRGLYRRKILLATDADDMSKKFLPLLDQLASSPDASVQTAVARGLGNLVLELREDLRNLNARPSYLLIVAAIAKIQKAPTVEARRASIETVGAIIRPLNPDAGEETLNPRGDPPARIDLLRVLELAPILFEGFKDGDALARGRAVSTFHRLASLMVKDVNTLIETPPIPVPSPDRKLLPAEIDLIKKNQDQLVTELDSQLRPRLEALHKEPAVYRRVLGDSDAQVRREALRALEDLALLQAHVQSRIIPLPKADAPKDPRPGPGQYIEPLFEATLPDVLKLLRSDDELVRLAAAQVLESRGDRAKPRAGDLVEALRDSNPFVRWTAARALGRFSGEPVAGTVAGLAKLVSDRDLSVRIAAANALETLGARGAEAESALAAVVNLGDADFREAGLLALGAVGRDGKQIVPAAAKELSNPDPRVRRAAAQTIGRFGESAGLARAALQAAIDDEDPDVRRFAAEALLAAEKK